MADKTKTLTVGIAGEDKGVGKPFDKAADKGDELARKLKAAGEKAGKGLDDGIEQGVKPLQTKLKAVGEKAGDRMKEGVSKGAEGLHSVGENASDAFSSGFDLDSITDIASTAFSGMSEKLGPIAGGAGIAVAGAFAVGLLNGMETEVSNDKLAASLGLDKATAEKAARISADLYGQAYGDSMDEVNAAVGAAATSIGSLTDMSERDFASMTGTALDFASTFDQDVTESIGAAGFAIHNGLARDADDAFDLMVGAMQKMPTSMRAELFPTLEEYGGFLHSLGFTGQQAFGLIASSSQGGTFMIDKTADALKELTIRGTDMSTTTKDAFHSIGLNAHDMASQFLAGGDDAAGALQKMALGLLAIEDPVKRSNTAIALFGTPLEDLSVTQIPDFLTGLLGVGDGLGDVSSKAEDMSATLNDNGKTSFEAFRRQALLKLTETVENTVLPKLEQLRDWAERNPTAFKVIAGVVGGALVIAFTAWAISAGAAAIATIAATWPLIAIGLAVAGLAALVAIHFDTIKGWVVGVFNWVRDNWPLLLAILTGPFGLAALAISRNWDTIKHGAAAAKDWVVDRFNGVVSFVTGLPGRIGRAASGMWDGISDSFKSAINKIIGWWNRLSFPTFDIPSIDPLGRFGPSIGGGSIGGWELPNIPELGDGGRIRARPGGTVIRVAERGDDEAIVPLDGRHDPRDPPIVVHVHIKGSVVSERDLNAGVNRGIDKGRRIRRQGRA